MVTGATGLVGGALVARLRAEGVRVLATARTYDAERALREMGAEPLHTDLANIGQWRREAEGADVVFHLAQPRTTPPLRRGAARRRGRAAAAGARALHEVAGDRPVVMLSTGLVHGSRAEPAVDDAPVVGEIALARAAAATEEALAGADLRVVRVPWVHGPGGLMRDLIVGLRIRRYRIVGTGTNAWAMLGADDAAAALVAAVGAPPGAYSAAEADIPTQADVVGVICGVPGHRHPDRTPLALAAMSMGGAMSQALSASLAIGTGRLADHGWAPRQDWREELVRLAEGSLPLPT
nr:NAD-dependent epimerase/dehydratase family protein [Miltoncostaea oceani]